jgi:hypothetical protein
LPFTAAAAAAPIAPPTTPPVVAAVIFFVSPFGLTSVPAISGTPSAPDASDAIGTSGRVCCDRRR